MGAKRTRRAKAVDAAILTIAEREYAKTLSWRPPRGCAVGVICFLGLSVALGLLEGGAEAVSGGLLLLAIAAGLERWTRAPKDSVERQEQIQRRVTAMNRQWETAVDVISQHSGTLAAEKRKLIQVDKWGRDGDEQAWEMERAEFIDEVLPTLVDTSLMVGELIALLALEVEQAASTAKAALASRAIDDDTVSRMTGTQFEAYSSEILEGVGWTVQMTPGSGDQGVDLIGRRDGMSIAFQCKRYAKPVGNKAIQEAASGSAFYGCEYAAVIALNGFTRSAKELANSLGVFLLAPEELMTVHTRVEASREKTRNMTKQS